MRINNDSRLSPIRMELEAKKSLKDEQKAVSSSSSLSSAKTTGYFESALEWVIFLFQWILYYLCCGFYSRQKEIVDPKSIPNLAELRKNGTQAISLALAKEKEERNYLQESYQLDLTPHPIALMTFGQYRVDVKREARQFYDSFDRYVLSGICQSNSPHVTERVRKEFGAIFKSVLEDDVCAAFDRATKEINARLAEDEQCKDGRVEAVFALIDEEKGLQYTATIGRCEVKSVSKEGKIVSTSCTWDRANEQQIVPKPRVTLFNVGEWVVLGNAVVWDHMDPHMLTSLINYADDERALAEAIAKSTANLCKLPADVVVMVLKRIDQ